MGENKHSEEIHAFSKKYLNEIPEESTSVDFTSNVMNRIEALAPVHDAFVFKPLISKKRGFFIGTAIFVLIMSVFNAERKTYFTLPQLDVSFMEKINFQPMFDAIQISSNTLYLVLISSALLWIQLFYLKRYFEKQF